MKKDKLFLKINLFALELFALCTIFNCIFKINNIDTYFFNIFNFNFTNIDILLMKDKYVYFYFKVITNIVLIIKLSAITLLPIFAFCKKSKPLYIVVLIIVFLDFFFISFLSKIYFIIFSNMLCHAVLFLLLWHSIKCIESEQVNN